MDLVNFFYPCISAIRYTFVRSQRIKLASGHSKPFANWSALIKGAFGIDTAVFIKLQDSYTFVEPYLFALDMLFFYFEIRD